MRRSILIQVVGILLSSTLSLRAALGVGTANCGQTAAGATVSTAGTVSIPAHANIVVFWSYSPGGGGCGATVTGVANVALDTFAAVGTANSSGYVCSGAFLAKNSNGSAVDVITVTFSGSVADASVTELPVTDPDLTANADAGPSNTGAASGSPAASASFNTSQAATITVGFAADYYVGDTIGTPTGYTSPAAGACNTRGTVQVAIAYKIHSSTQTGITVSFPITGSGYTNVSQVTLKEAASASARRRGSVN